MEGVIANVLIDLVVAVLLYVVAIWVGIFIKRNGEYYYPVLFALMYGNYVALRYYFVYSVYGLGFRFE